MFFYEGLLYQESLHLSLIVLGGMQVLQVGTYTTPAASEEFL